MPGPSNGVTPPVDTCPIAYAPLLSFASNACSNTDVWVTDADDGPDSAVAIVDCSGILNGTDPAGVPTTTDFVFSLPDLLSFVASASWVARKTTLLAGAGASDAAEVLRDTEPSI